MITANQIEQQQIHSTQLLQVFNKPNQLLKAHSSLTKVIIKIRGVKVGYSHTLGKTSSTNSSNQATDSPKEPWIKDLCNSPKTLLRPNKH